MLAAVSMTTGTSVTSRIRWSVCQPSMSGIVTSRRHEVGDLAEDVPQRGAAIDGFRDVVAGALEEQAHQAANVGLVVDNEHVWLGHVDRSLP